MLKLLGIVVFALFIGIVIYFFPGKSLGDVGTHDVMTLSGYKPKSFTPTPNLAKFLASLKAGAEFSFENHQKKLWALTKPLTKYSAGYDQNGGGNNNYPGTNFTRHELCLVNNNPKIILGIFLKDGKIVDWMLFSPDGFEIPKQGFTSLFDKYIREMYCKAKK